MTRKMITFLSLILVFAVGLCACRNVTTTQTTTIATTTVTTKATTTATAETTEKIEPVTLTVLTLGMVIDASDSVVLNQLKEMTGITLDFAPSLRYTDVATALPLMLASDEVPDMVNIGDADLRVSVLKAKAAHPLDDLVATHGPNLQANMGEALKLSKLLRSDETNALYFIPQCTSKEVNAVAWTNKGWSIRWDLYKQLGTPPIDTVDQFFDVLKQMMELEPENKHGQKTYGLGNFFGESWGWVIPGNAIKSMMGYVQLGTSPIEINMNTEKVSGVYSDINGPAFTMLEYWNKAWRMGILDPESITLKFTEFNEIAATGKYMASVISWTGASAATARFFQEGETDKGYVPVKVGVTNDYAYVYETAYLGSHGSWFISSKSAAPERAVEVFDFLTTEEGYMLFSYGNEGEQYEYDEEGYVNSLLPSPLSDEDRKQTGLGVFGNLVVLGRIIPANPKTIWDEMMPVHQDYCTHYGFERPVDVYADLKETTFDYSLAMSISIDPMSDLANVDAEVQRYLPVAVPKLIFQDTEEEFNAFKQEFYDTIMDMGYAELVESLIKKYEDALIKLETLSN